MRNPIIYLLILSALLFYCMPLSGCLCQVTIGEPEIREVSYEWGEVTPSRTEIITKVKVYNPNPIHLPLKNVLSEVYMGDIKMGEGSALKAGIRANSESTVVITTKLDNTKIPQWWVSHIRNNEKSTIKVTATLVFDLKVTDFNYPFEFSKPIETNILAGLNPEKTQKFKSGPVTLTMSIESHWGAISEDYTEIMTTASIYNASPYPIPVPRLDCFIQLNEIKIAKGLIDGSTIIAPKSETMLTFTTKLDNKMLDDWWVSHIKGGERTQGVVTIKYSEFTLVKQEFEFTTNLLKR